jgi:hypothetical protein
MTDLRKAAEMALKDWLANDEGVVRFGMELKPEWVSTVSHGFLSGYEEALRQALAHPEQELVIDCPRCGHCCPEREWVGLTRLELDIATLGLEDLSDCYKAIEAKLKEKNA